MTDPAVPERLAAIAREAVRQLETVGAPVTRETLKAARMSYADVLEVIVPWALEVAAGEYLRERS